MDSAEASFIDLMPFSLCPQTFSNDVDAFYCKISEGLDLLHRLLIPDFISSQFVLQALEFLASLHSGLISLAEKLKLPASQPGEGWLSEYIDETVKMVEVCNALKVGVSGLELYLARVEAVVGPRLRIEQALDACKDEIDRIETENRSFVQAKFETEGILRYTLSDNYVESKFAKWNGFWGIMFAVKNVSSFLSWLLIWGVTYAGSSIHFRIEPVSFKFPWAASFIRLQQIVSDSTTKLRLANSTPVMLLTEFKAIEIPLTDLRAHRVRGGDVRRVQRELRRHYTALIELLETLDWQRNDLLDVIVEGRRKLLETFGNSYA